MMLTETARCKVNGPRGFTLIELMISLAVGALLLTLALPSFSTLLERNRIGSAADQLYASLATARGEAIKRRSSVRVCPTLADIDYENPSCRNDGIWSDGWLVFADDDGNGQPNSAADVIKAVPSASLDDGVGLGCDVAVEDGVAFAATGTAWGNAGAFRVCHSNSLAPSREVSIAAGGRIEYTTRDQTDCGGS